MAAQEKESRNPIDFADLSQVPTSGRILALDLGTKRIGVAVCDEARILATQLPRIDRTSWKKLLSQIGQLLQQFDAKALVIGLPLDSAGGESEMSLEARDIARKFALSLDVSVFLQDERVSSFEANARLWQRGLDPREADDAVDSEAAAVILGDFLERLETFARSQT